MNSLDPRITRLLNETYSVSSEPKVPLDQFATFEVFVQPREGKPFQHEGITHAPNLEMAYVLAKEAFTRRFVCVALYVVETCNVYSSPMLEGDANVYSSIGDQDEPGGVNEEYEIYHLTKRGKQHIHAGTFAGRSRKEALAHAAQKFSTAKSIVSVWAVRKNDIRFTQPEEMDLWNTLPEKKFRDAAAYKGGERLSEFLKGRG